MHACIDNKHSLNLSYTFTPLARANPLGLAGLFAGLPFGLFVGLFVGLCWRSTSQDQLTLSYFRFKIDISAVSEISRAYWARYKLGHIVTDTD